MELLYLTVEGPHDRAVCYRLLMRHGLKRVSRVADVLAGPWGRLVPRRFPPEDDFAVDEPVRLPWVMQKERLSLALTVGGGSSLPQRLVDDLVALGSGLWPSLHLGFVVDADKVAPASRHKQVLRDLRVAASDASVTLPEFADSPGIVGPGPPRAGGFVLPDNCAHGTLDVLLMECAAVEYPPLHEEAACYIGRITSEHLSRHDDRKDFVKTDATAQRAAAQKATAAAMVAVLRPGKAIATSLRDNAWVTERSVTQTRLAALDDFIRALLGP